MKLLNYPVAHHRRRRAIREEELALEPDFAATWPGFADWGAGHEEQLDAEIEQCDAVLLGSDFAASSFVASGVLNPSPPQIQFPSNQQCGAICTRESVSSISFGFQAPSLWSLCCVIQFLLRFFVTSSRCSLLVIKFIKS
jgi:hypothetical protein